MHLYSINRGNEVLAAHIAPGLSADIAPGLAADSAKPRARAFSGADFKYRSHMQNESGSTPDWSIPLRSDFDLTGRP